MQIIDKEYKFQKKEAETAVRRNYPFAKLKPGQCLIITCIDLARETNCVRRSLSYFLAKSKADKKHYKIVVIEAVQIIEIYRLSDNQ